MASQQRSHPPDAASAAQTTPNNDEIRAKMQAHFKKRPCDWQLELYRAQKNTKNIISIARTGSGKTLTYFLPLIDSTDGVVIIVTALNVLGDQFEREALAAGFSAKSVNGKNDTNEVFKVRIYAIRGDPSYTLYLSRA